MTEPSLWSFIVNADFVVKLVMIILLLASIVSWAIIIQRFVLFKQTHRTIKHFEQRFWSDIDLTNLFHQLSERSPLSSGIATIFRAGFTEFTRLHQQSNTKPEAVMEGTQRAMRIAQVRESENLERNLSFLATVGSTSPYVGLFGTVWGIMTAFRALGTVQQATIALVAPGIAEALIATAIGLLAAIPAVIAYNRFSSDLAAVLQTYDTFREEFSNILHRKVHS